VEKKYLSFGRTLPMTILIIVVTAASFSYYKRSNSPHHREKETTRLLPENISDSTQGFSFAQADHGKTTFEFKAKSKLGLKDNKILLEYVTVKVYGREGDRFDTITSDRCEYNQTADEILFFDNVVIELGPLNKVLSRNQTDSSGGSGIRTQVKVDRIKYLQKTGIAQTDEEVNFVRGRLHGRSQGLTYNSTGGTLQLHSQVEMFVEPEGSSDSQVQFRTGSLTYFKTSNVVQMQSGVWIRKLDNETRADKAEAFLDSSDSSLTRINAAGHVQSLSRDPKSMLEVDADRATYLFRTGGRWLNKVIAEGEVRSRSLNEQVKRNLSADRLEITMKPDSDSIDTLTAAGNVVAVLTDKIAGTGNTMSDPDSGPGPGDKVIRSPEIVAFFGPGQRLVSRMEARGPSVLEDLPSQPADDKRILSALDLVVTFEVASNKIEKCLADRDVKVNVIPAAGPVKRTSNDHLVALMDKQTHQVSQFHQFGNFQYQEEGRQASSEEARYFAQDKIIRLEGRPEVSDASSKTTAHTIELHQLQNLFKAAGNVRSVSYNQDSQAKTAVFEPGSPVYASSEFMETETTTGVAKYWNKAKLWQKDQVIGADTIYLYRSERRLVAEEHVHSLFYLQKRNSGKSEQEREPVAIQAQRMVYEDSLQKAVYEQDVSAKSSMGVLNSKRLEIFLETKEKQTAVRRLLASGEVKVRQPGRTSFSDSAEYFRDEGRLLLIGGPPRVLDSERGSTTGARLTMNLNDGSISVEGDPETRTITRRIVAR
jgi:lipopolysaccharide export system protein LptA